MTRMFNPYGYKTNEEVVEHLGLDLVDMMICIEREGYVVQEQFAKLDAYLCESYSSNIVEMLNARMLKISVLYACSSPSNFYVFYDTSKLTYEEAEERAEEQKERLYGK